MRLDPFLGGLLDGGKIFQFHKGAIRTGGSGLLILDDLPFQFHKGAIRTPNHSTACRYILNFNSIKVRLERSRIGSVPVCSIFQFHKGAIRTNTIHRRSDYHLYFNSIKVRLELGRVGKCSPMTIFQFHKGAIRTL